jgi:hypothetical protein
LKQVDRVVSQGRAAHKALRTQDDNDLELARLEAVFGESPHRDHHAARRKEVPE